jgi:hypothetical protein
VILADTTEKRNPKTTMRAAPRMFTRNAGTSQINTISARVPKATIVMGVSFSVRRTAAVPPLLRRSPESCFTEAFNESQMAGDALMSPTIPPAATAPAPIYLM